MEVTKQEKKAQKKAFKKARRRAIRPWKFLTWLSLPLAIILIIATVVVLFMASIYFVEWDSLLRTVVAI